MSAIFRAKALSKLRSPEQLDEPLKIITRRTKLAWSTVASVLILGLAWGIFGRLPEAGRGQAVILTPNTVFPIQAQAEGQVGIWYVAVGAQINKGDVLGILEQPATSRQLAQAKEQLEEIEHRNQVLGELRDRFNALEREAIEKKRSDLKARIDYLTSFIERTRNLTDNVHARSVEMLEQQQTNVNKTRLAKAALTTELGKRLESYERLRSENLAPEDAVRSRRRDFDDSRMQLRDLNLQSQELDLNRIEANETYLSARNNISTKEHQLTQLELDLQGLDNRIASLNKSEREQLFRDQNEIKDLKRSIERDQKRLQRDREIKSEYAGRVLELTSPEGAVVTQGKRLAQIDTREPDAELIALAYFEDKIGKQINPGDFIRISPSTVVQSRFGSIVGEVISVSEFPVTDEAVINYVGNREVAQKLTAGGFQIEVITRMKLNPNTPSGFAWTSQAGPDTVITAGTTADAWITYERRPPISYLLPKVKEWTGL